MIPVIILVIIAYVAYPPEIWIVHYTKFSMGLWLRILATIVCSILAISIFANSLKRS